MNNIISYKGYNYFFNKKSFYEYEHIIYTPNNKKLFINYESCYRMSNIIFTNWIDLGCPFLDKSFNQNDILKKMQEKTNEY